MALSGVRAGTVMDIRNEDVPDPGSVPDTCDQCGCELYPSEIAEGRCRRCVEDAAAEAR